MKRVFTPVKKKTILLVDDDHLSVHIYRSKLERQGFKVEVAHDADSALHDLQKGIVDLAIIDLSLPGINPGELIKNIRSESDLQALPIIAFSNPYLNSLARASSEAGAMKCVAKIESTPEQIFELARELGISVISSAVTTGVVERLEANQEKLVATLLVNEPDTLAKLRVGHQTFARAAQDDSRSAELLEMHRQLRSLTGGASLLGFQKIARVSTALEALLIELHTKPAKITPSVVRTVAQAIDTLASLFDQAANPQPELSTAPKILVVDDEVISRETICSALRKADLHAESADDPLAAQSLLEQNHFDLIFLDVEMPGLSGLELCVKIREMTSNRTTPVVFVTSHSDFGSRAQSTLSGGNDFIAKPFVLVELAVKALTWLFRKSPPAPSTPSPQDGPGACARRGSNPQPLAPEANALSS